MAVQPYSATAQIKALTGTAATPGITFTGGDIDTGIYSPGANQVGISTGGVSRLLIGSDGSITSSGAFSFPLGSAAAPSLYPGTDTNTGIYSPGANQLALATNGTGRLFVDASGNVGAGTNSPTSKLTVRDEGGTDEAALRIEAYRPALRFIDINTATTDAEIRADSGNITFNTGLESDPATLLTERLRITSDGKVGVGTSSPGALLSIAGGSAYVVGNSGQAIAGIDIAATAGGSGLFGGALSFGVGGTGRAAIAGVQGSSDTDVVGLGFFVHGSSTGSANAYEAMRITSGGNVGIGSTAASSRLHVVNPSGGAGTTEVSTIERDNSGYFFKLYRNTGSGNAGGLIGADSVGTYYTGGHTTQNMLYIDGANAVMRFYTNNLERGRWDSSGRFLVGTSSARSNLGGGTQSARLQVEGTSGDTARISQILNGNNSNPIHYIFAKSRGTTVGSNTIVQSGDNIGQLSFEGSDGTNFVQAASITGAVDGTPGANDMPGRLVFSTTADGASSPTERLRINNTGALGLSGANFGTQGQALISNGSTAPPTWQSISPTTVFGWNHTNDAYGLYLPGTSISAGALSGTVDINVQSRLRRCVINDAGAVQYYLDADDSTLKAGDWLRIVETEALDTPYTGTTTEATNSLLRVGVPAWVAGTFTRGQRVTHNGFVWECIAASTTATPAAGTVASDLTGTGGQVVVEVPAFSVRYGFANGVHTREVRLGCNDNLIAQGFRPHSAFIKTDGTYKDAFYMGAYHAYSDGTNLASVSGQTNTRSLTRGTFRSRAALRGTGWHLHSYLEHAAVQTLLVCEYRDHNSQKVVGNGSNAGTTFGVTTGQSNARGNRSANSTGNVSVADDYMSYRGIENLYGRAWQWVDGFNVYERVVYLTNNQSAFADNTSVGYRFYAQVPTGSSSYQKEIFPLPDVFLPSVVTGASDTSYLGDAFWTNTGWRVALVGGGSSLGAPVGAFALFLLFDSGNAGAGLGSRLSYAQN